VIFVCTVVPANAFEATEGNEMESTKAIQDRLDYYHKMRSFFDDRILALEHILRDQALKMESVTYPTCVSGPFGLEFAFPDVKELMRVELLADSSRAYVYDRNGDGKMDFVAIVPPELNRYPEEYQVDNNYDLTPEFNMVDTLRDGTCLGIQPKIKVPLHRHDGDPADCVTQDCDKRKEGRL